MGVRVGTLEKGGVKMGPQEKERHWMGGVSGAGLQEKGGYRMRVTGEG
jgi:hypothetical protein